MRPVRVGPWAREAGDAGLTTKGYIMGFNPKRTWHVVYKGQRPFGVQVTGTAYTAAQKAFGPFGSIIVAGDGETEQQVLVHDRAGRLLGTLFYLSSPKAQRAWRMARELAATR